ncbi:hypothetical protein OPV22_030653 [Ensete ventricosum]|uniref:Uncharacterized protein n=1 Tax=Ensete ventricosum TaxID=4639 RepID=A0AAV8Q6Q2_ENSVE|nr:hypothetical protein OPV22_030653 [Ensete ventricosum]
MPLPNALIWIYTSSQPPNGDAATWGSRYRRTLTNEGAPRFLPVRLASEWSCWRDVSEWVGRTDTPNYYLSNLRTERIKRGKGR